MTGLDDGLRVGLPATAHCVANVLNFCSVAIVSDLRKSQVNQILYDMTKKLHQSSKKNLDLRCLSCDLAIWSIDSLFSSTHFRIGNDKERERERERERVVKRSEGKQLLQPAWLK